MAQSCERLNTCSSLGGLRGTHYTKADRPTVLLLQFNTHSFDKGGKHWILEVPFLHVDLGVPSVPQ